MCGCFFLNQRSAAACAYDSSTDVFKINLVYKDAKGQEHELKWLIKVTRSDVNEVAEALLRHEKQGQRKTHHGTVDDNGGILPICLYFTHPITTLFVRKIGQVLNG